MSIIYIYTNSWRIFIRICIILFACENPMNTIIMIYIYNL